MDWSGRVPSRSRTGPQRVFIVPLGGGAQPASRALEVAVQVGAHRLLGRLDVCSQIGLMPDAQQFLAGLSGRASGSR
jgi:hypothetical protein